MPKIWREGDAPGTGRTFRVIKELQGLLRPKRFGADWFN